MPETKASAAQQVAFIEKRLLQLFIAKHDAETTVANSNTEILSLRNVLSGMPIGQQLAAEITAEQQAVAVPLTPPSCPAPSVALHGQRGTLAETIRDVGPPSNIRPFHPEEPSKY